MSKKIIAYITGLVAVLAIAGAIGIGVTMNATPEVAEAHGSSTANTSECTWGNVNYHTKPASVDQNTGIVTHPMKDRLNRAYLYPEFILKGFMVKVRGNDTIHFHSGSSVQLEYGHVAKACISQINPYWDNGNGYGTQYWWITSPRDSY